MPKIILGGQGWKSVEVPGGFANDANLAFLSSFEELTAGEADTVLDQHDRIKKSRKRKSGKKSPKVGLKNGGAAIRKVKQKGRENKKSKRKRKDRETVTNEEASNLQIGPKNSSVTVMAGDGNAENKGKKRKMEEKKRKKHSFTTEEPPKKKEKIGIAENCGSDLAVRSANGESARLESPATAVSDVDLSLWEHFCLPSEIMMALRELGFTSPTEIQSCVIPSAVRDRTDILGAAETGSGKTLAFGIPVVARLLELDRSDSEGTTNRGLRVLILAPTRELVVQIRKQLDQLLKYTTFKTASVVGGLSQQKQERLLRYCPEVIVATPGRFWAIMGSAPPGSYLGNWSQLLAVVIDETDRMVEKGHFEELQHILDCIKTNGNEKRQTLVFSATLTFVHPAPKRLSGTQYSQMTREEKIKRLVEITGMRKERKIFDLTRSVGTVESLIETRMNCSNLTEKDTGIVYLLTRYPGRTLIFLNSVDASRRLHGILLKLRYNPLPLMLHARMVQKQRLKNLERFEEQKNAVLLATDVAARGLDIRGVEHVIHYQVPRTAELYVHRSGRTARASQKGLTVLMVDAHDSRFYRRICRNLNRENELPIFPVDCPQLMEALKIRVMAATELESIEHKMKKISARENWFKKTAYEADILLNERDGEQEQSNEQLSELRRQRNGREALLKRLLVEPLPRFDRFLTQKTRYITPEVAAEYERSAARDALSSFEESTSRNENSRKNALRLIKTWHLHRGRQRRTHKLKRK